MNVVEKSDSDTMEKSIKASNKKKSKNKKNQTQEKLITENYSTSTVVACNSNKKDVDNINILNGDTENVINKTLTANHHMNGCIEKLLLPKNKKIKSNNFAIRNGRTNSPSFLSNENKEHEQVEENDNSNAQLASQKLDQKLEIKTNKSKNVSEKQKEDNKSSKQEDSNIENDKESSSRITKKQKKSKSKTISKTIDDHLISKKSDDNCKEISTKLNSVSITSVKDSKQNKQILQQKSTNCLDNLVNCCKHVDCESQEDSSLTLSRSNDCKITEKDNLDQKLDDLKKNISETSEIKCDDENKIKSANLICSNENNTCSANISCVNENINLPKEISSLSRSSALPNEASSIDSSFNLLDRPNIVIEYKEYESELQMQDIMRLIQTELSEPYSIYTYRYFIYNWPKLCFLAAHGDEYVGAIVCKLDMHMNVKRGYIAMLAVKKEYRKLGIGTNLVQKAIEAMLSDNADEVVLETEMKNIPALRLYENLGFVRDKRLFRYYLNGVDALRLKLWFR